MIRKVLIPALDCTCEKCGCRWFSLGQTPPRACSTCKSKEWNGAKERQKPEPKIVISLPKPVRVRSLEDEQ